MDVYTAKGTSMKRLAVLLLPLALAAALPAIAATPKGPATIAAALEEGARQHKPVLIDFQAVWCYSCYFMASHVLTGDEFKALESKVIFVEADADKPDGQAWMKKLNVHFLPTYVALDEHGNELGRILAERPRDKFYAEVAGILSGNQRLDKLKGDAQKGSLAAVAAVLDDYQKRYAGAEGLAWFETLPPVVKNVADKDRDVALGRQQLLLLKAKADKNDDGIADAARHVLAGRIGCQRPYVIDDLLGATAAWPPEKKRAAALEQKEAMRSYVDTQVLVVNPPCADIRSGVLSLADVDAAAGDAAGEKAILDRAIDMTRGKLGSKVASDRNLADNLRVYLVRAKRTDEVDALELKLIAAYPDDYVYSYRHGRNLVETGRAKEALPFLEKAAAKAYGANRLQVATYRAKALIALGRKDEAKKVVDTVLAQEGQTFPEAAARLRQVVA
jgi:thioredoxin-like negative regulator of GroEL